MFNGSPQGASQIAQGATLYILNRKDFSLALATVTAVSQPHLSKAAQTNPAMMMQGFVIDLTVSIGNDTTTLEFPVNSVSASYADRGWFVSPDPMATVREIESQTSMSKQHLSQNSWHEMVVQKSPSLIQQVLPEKKAEAEQSQKMAMLESKIAEMNGKFDKILAGLFPSGNPANTNKEE